MNKINLIVQENLILEKGDPLGAIIASCVDSETAYDILRKLQEHELLSEILKKTKTNYYKFCRLVNKKRFSLCSNVWRNPKKIIYIRRRFYY